MARLAWFSPWPPQPSGVAAVSADAVPLLAGHGHAITVFTDEAQVPVARAPVEPPAPGVVRIEGAHEFVWRERRGQFDLVVYQVGNSRLHEFVWPYLFRWPGLVVLHDGRLHHARARALLSRHRVAEYRAEFAWNQPDVADAAELAVAGFDGAYYYQWPMLRAAVDSARFLACHSRGALAELAERWPDRSMAYVALGHGPLVPDRAAGRALRAAHGLTDALVFGVFGALTEEKRLPQILRTFAAVHARVPATRLLLAGAPDRRLGLPDLVRGFGVTDAVILAPDLDAAAFDAAILACDVALCLRWPTALETSGPWLRALAAGRPTVIVDLAHQWYLPTLDPRTWHLHTPGRARPPRDAGEPVAVAIDILDEEHSLRMALQRLAEDPDLRQRLGAAGRRYWEREHTVERMVEDYARVIALSLAAAPDARERPPYLVPDPVAHTRRVLAPLGVSAPASLDVRPGSGQA